MSRYTINQQPEVVVGWDDQLGTFFGHVYDTDGECIAHREVQTIKSLDIWLSVDWNAPIPAEVRASLTADRSADWEPGPLQRRIGYTGVFVCNPDESGGVLGPDGNVYSDADPGL